MKMSFYGANIQDLFSTRPQPNDVLFGRGVAINNHEGNVQFRKFVEERKCDFLLAARKKKEKANIARDVFSKVHSLGGRFLEHVKITSTLSFWHEVDGFQVHEKCMQTLRSTKRGMTESQVEAAKKKALERKREQQVLIGAAEKQVLPSEEVFQPVRHSFAAALNHHGSIEHFNQLPQPNDIRPNDVLFGRGVTINVHPGNVQFRRFMDERKGDFLLASKNTQKRRIVREVLQKIHSLGGRFLELVQTTTEGHYSESWHEVNNTQANEKCMQALRRRQGMTESQVEAAKKKALERQKEQEHERTEKESLAQPNDCVSACDAETEDAQLDLKGVGHSANEKTKRDRALIKAYPQVFQVQTMAPPSPEIRQSSPVILGHSKHSFGPSSEIRGNPMRVQAQPTLRTWLPEHPQNTDHSRKINSGTQIKDSPRKVVPVIAPLNPWNPHRHMVRPNLLNHKGTDKPLLRIDHFMFKDNLLDDQILVNTS